MVVHDSRCKTFSACGKTIIWQFRCSKLGDKKFLEYVGHFTFYIFHFCVHSTQQYVFLQDCPRSSSSRLATMLQLSSRVSITCTCSMVPYLEMTLIGLATLPGFSLHGLVAPFCLAMPPYCLPKSLLSPQQWVFLPLASMPPSLAMLPCPLGHITLPYLTLHASGIVLALSHVALDTIVGLDLSATATWGLLWICLVHLPTCVSYAFLHNHTPPPSFKNYVLGFQGHIYWLSI